MHHQPPRVRLQTRPQTFHETICLGFSSRLPNTAGKHPDFHRQTEGFMHIRCVVCILLMVDGHHRCAKKKDVVELCMCCWSSLKVQP